MSQRADNNRIICRINSKRAQIRFTRDKRAVIYFKFEQSNSKDYNYDSHVKHNYKTSASLTSIYAGKLPKGKIRKYMCQLLHKIIDKGYLDLDDNIIIEASGDINGSFTALLNMYRRMSFEPIGIMMSEEDDQSQESQSQSEEYIIDIPQLKRYLDTNTELGDEYNSVLMVTSVGDLLDWCLWKYDNVN